MAKKGSDKGTGGKDDEGLTIVQKVILSALVAFIPFFFLILLPLLTRNHLITTMRIPPEVLLGTPLRLNMGLSEDPQPTLALQMNGVKFQIPRNFTPVGFGNNVVTFRNNPRRISRTISISVQKEPPRLDLRTSGIIGLFMPSDLRPFLEKSLWATWHPVHLYCKAEFLVTQGIGGSFFITDWDAHHSGFVFPTPGNTGYLARIFSDAEDRYIEVAYFDETDPVKLANWVDVAVRVKPPFESGETPAPAPAPRAPSLAAMIGQVANEETAPFAMQDSLNQFFQTGSASWLLPCGLLMENRLFFRETIDLCKKALPRVKEDKQMTALWRDLFDRAVKQILKLDIDPHLDLDQVLIYGKNLSQFPVRRIRLRITCLDAAGERTFSAMIQEAGTMQPQDEKTYKVVTKPGFLSGKLQGISLSVEDLEVGD